MLDVYGTSVVTVGGADWQRYRKIVATPFHEGTMELTWNKSITQVTNMLSVWTGYQEIGTPGVARDCCRLSGDIIAATVFHQ